MVDWAQTPSYLLTYSTVLVFKRLASFAEGADSVRLVGSISVDRCAEIKMPSMANPNTALIVEDGCRKARLGVCF